LNTLKLLCSVHGIGPAAAKKFIEKGVDDLSKLPLNELNHQQKIGLKYHQEFNERIPRKEILEIEALIIPLIKEVDSHLIATICGSFRRGCESSGDIDILVAHEKCLTKEDVKKNYVGDIVAQLTKKNILTDNLTEVGGNAIKWKYMGVCKLNDGAHRRIDIRLVPFESYWYGLLYFTGSAFLNRLMRTVAISKGLTLNETGLTKAKQKKGSSIPAQSERDIFEALGMKYLEPEERNL